MIHKQNTIAETLIQLGISSSDSLEPFYPRTRDREDIGVLRCQRSGVILTTTTAHLSETTYTARTDLTYWKAVDRNDVLREQNPDDTRRFRILEPHIRNRAWLDVGTGLGGILDIAGQAAKTVAAVELQTGARRVISDLGYTVYDTVSSVPNSSFDVVSAFHVYEHVSNPIEFLAEIRRILRPGGTLVLEVPHARDFLIEHLSLDAFMAFTFWSEHLLLHTRESLRRFISHAGFNCPTIIGVQRYSIANHLYWLSLAKPGGHIAWSYLSPPALAREYEAMLSSLDQTDTLVAWAKI